MDFLINEKRLPQGAAEYHHVMKLFSFFLLLILDTLAHAQGEWNSTVVRVTGTNTVTIPSDVVHVRLGITNQALNASDAQMATTNASNAIVEALTGLNVTNLATEDLSLNPMYNYTLSPSTIVGFESSSVVSYDTTPTLAGQTLDAGIKAGANTIDSFTMTANDTAQMTAYNRALVAATDDAKKKATLVTFALDMCIGDVVSLDISSSSDWFPPSPSFIQMDATSSATSVPSIIPKSLDVSATVQASFSYHSC